MKIGRFVVDGHIHCGKKDHHDEKADPKIGSFGAVEQQDNSDIALFDMDVYGIDMGILLPSFIGTTNELHAEMVRKHPTRLRSCCMDTTQRIRSARGEVKWNIETALKEIDEALTKYPDVFVGIGEFAPGCMRTIREIPSFEQRVEEWDAIAKLAIKHDVVVHFHEFVPSEACLGRPTCDAWDVLVKTAYNNPKCKILVNHGGGATEYEIWPAIQAATTCPNIYLETGYWKAEFYELALNNPNIGATRLIWGGGDTGSRIWVPHALRPGAKLLPEHQFYYNRMLWPNDYESKEVDYQPDWYGWPIHQIRRLMDLNLAVQDQINLIVGGNAARIYNLPTPRPKEEIFAHGRPDLHIR